MPRNTQSNRGNSNRRSKNNNPEGYNQYNSGWMDSARERPVAAAGLAAAAVGAGVFLWSRRNQISEQLSNLSDQIGEWSETMSSDREFETAGGETSFSGSADRASSGSSRSSGSEFSGKGTASSGMATTSAGSSTDGRSGKGSRTTS